MIRSLAILLAALLIALAPAACGPASSQDTPEATIEAARRAVADAQPRRIARLIEADGEEMRRLLDRFGVFLANVQDLGLAVQEKFPKEVAEVRARAEQAAKDGKATSLLATITQQGGRGRKRPSGKQRVEARAAFDTALKGLFADPYAWLRDSETRLTTAYLTEETVALLWDGKPVLAPLGMIMRRGEDGRWCFVLPTNFPGVSALMPRTPDEFKIWGSLITVFDRVVVDLTKDVRTGRLGSLDGLAQEAGEKTFIPAALTFLAYNRLREIKKKEAKEAAVLATPAPK